MRLRASGPIVMLVTTVGCATTGRECPEPTAAVAEPSTDQTATPSASETAAASEASTDASRTATPDSPPDDAPSTPDASADASAKAWPWPGPQCIAFSPRQASYACVSLTATPTADSEYDLTSPSMRKTMERVRATSADVELGVDFVSVHGSRTLVVRDSEPDAFTTHTPLDEVETQLSTGGYEQPITAHRMLDPDAWVKVGRVWLRYSTRIHEGDASFEIYGRIDLRCQAKGPIRELALTHPDDHIGGPFAMVSSAGSSPLHAVTIEHHDGGEGYVDVRWSSWVFDELQWCPPP